MLTLFRLVLVLCVVTAWLFSHDRYVTAQDFSAISNEPVPADLDRRYQDQTQDLLAKYCYECHAQDVAEAEIDLAAFSSVDEIRKQPKVWLRIAEMLDSRQMPPKDSTQPTEAEHKELRAWVRDFLTAEARATAGDPGPVLLRRLSNAEYNYTIGELTGLVGLDPTREFPVDGAAGEGFTNTGASQGMSPALVQKYLDAAKEIAAHATLFPNEVRFSAHASRRDLTDELLIKIRQFYGRYTTSGGGSTVNLQGIEFDTNQGGLLPLESYLGATITHRSALQQGTRTIEQVAEECQLSPKYLRNLWTALNQRDPRLDDSATDLLRPIRARWRNAELADIPLLVADINVWRTRLWKFNVVGHLGREGAPQSWIEEVSPASDVEASSSEAIPTQENDTTPANRTDEVPRGDVEQAYAQFRKLFPFALCYTKIVPVDEVVTATLFHREDQLLIDLMLDESATAEIDRLWDELHYVSEEPLKALVALEQIREFSTQDRQDLVGPWDKLRPTVEARAAAFRERVQATFPLHVESLLTFAERAWRRPLAQADRAELRDLYHDLRARDIDHEATIRLLVARVLTSPAFLYRIEKQPTGEVPQPVSDMELANRLSYFLWSSPPDQELRLIAERGQLQGMATSDVTSDVATCVPTGVDTEVVADMNELTRQTRRMLRDPRTRRLAIHFACQWLHVRDFDQNDEKNEQLYPQFAELRSDMYEETVRFFEDLFRNDGSVLDIFDSDHTFLNGRLAQHYGIKLDAGDAWQRVTNLKSHGRGGVLGMATILASQSGASRTSPILRGNWVSETLLGERLPRPPANVPQLPTTVPEGLTARQLIEQHSSAPECATCHQRIDPYGFALEQFDAIGRQRDQSVDTHTRLIDGTALSGAQGLRDYLVQSRQHDIVRQFCRKLLGYALGREVQLSDEPLLAEMAQLLESHGFRFQVAVESIVNSSQFRMIRSANLDKVN